jgi:hypothetical protein
MTGGPSRDESLAQCGARAVCVRALGLGLEDRFDGDGIHSIHKSLGWPSSPVSVAPHGEVAL